MLNYAIPILNYVIFFIFSKCSLKVIPFAMAEDRPENSRKWSKKRFVMYHFIIITMLNAHLIQLSFFEKK